MLPVACRRCIHLIAELGLTSNQSAASRRDAPDSTASTTRSRNSKEHGFGIDPPSKTRIGLWRGLCTQLKNFPSRACRSRIACSLVLLLISPLPPVVKPESKTLPGPAGDGRGNDLSKSRRRVGSAAGVGHHLRLVYLSRAAPLARTALGADVEEEVAGEVRRFAPLGLLWAERSFSPIFPRKFPDNA
jgi:hypothetical protein